MNISTIILIVAFIASCSADGNNTFDLCAWQTKRNDIVKQFTPNGQAAIQVLLKDLQYYTGAAIQPICDHMGVEYNSTINQLKSSDSASLTKVSTLLGCGNVKSGAGNLIDLCEMSRNITNALKSFKPENQATAASLLKTFANYLSSISKIVISIVNLKNENQVAVVAKENPQLLYQLAKLYGY